MKVAKVLSLDKNINDISSPKNQSELQQKQQSIGCLFINPMDMIAAVPYVKTLWTIALLRQQGVTVHLIDPAPERKKIADIVSFISRHHPTIICISAVPSTLPFAYQLVNAIKQAKLDVVIVLEGYHVNADPSIVREMGVDYGLLGDVEYPMLELCTHILAQRPVPKSSSGLVINQNGELIVNPPHILKDLNNLPTPAFELMQIGKYFSASTNKKLMYMFTTRGCPYECNFCTIPNQRLYRYLSIDNTIHQLKYLIHDLGIEWVEFMDLTFTVSKKRVLQLCDEIIAQGLVFEWGCETRADLIDDEMLKAMKAAGCAKITFGVESGNEEVRFKTGKKITNTQFKEAIHLCEKNNIRTMTNFIIGHPNETEEQMLDTIKFAKELNPFNVLYIRMTPLPDVDIYTEGVKSGEISPDIWTKYMKGEIAHPTYYPKTISPKRMEAIFRKALLSYYLSFNTIKKYLFLFKDMRFLMKSVRVFIEYTFGGPRFK